MNQLLLTQSVRDPIYNWIAFSEQEKAIIDSPLVQRLKFVGQLTGVYQVFPGGIHHRFSHSLGAMHVAGLYAEHLSQYLVGEDATTEKRKCFIQIARIAALLHDIGHGPYSHSYDHSIYRRIYAIDDGGHDLHRLNMVRSTLLAPYIVSLGIWPDDLVEVWTQKGVTSTSQSIHRNPRLSLLNQSLYPIISHIVQGPIGADRVDFTLRDSYFTGTEHFGTIAYHRIVSNSLLRFRSIKADYSGVCGQYDLYYKTKSLDDIEQALDGRFYMYKGVYLHKTCGAAEILIHRMMEACANDLNLVERTNDLEQFVDLHDYSIVGQILTLDKEHPARKYWERISRRHFPKLIWERLVNIDQMDLSESITIGVQDYLKRKGLQPDEKPQQPPTIASERVIRGNQQPPATASERVIRGNQQPPATASERVIRWTRIFGGMNLQKFDDLGIHLISKDGTVSQFKEHQQRTDKKYLILRCFEV